MSGPVGQVFDDGHKLEGLDLENLMFYTIARPGSDLTFEVKPND